MIDGGLDNPPTEEQLYAADAITEYHYRKMFGLSKAEMLKEPIRDIERNLLIDQLLGEKQKQKRAIMEKVSKARMRSR